MIEVIVLLGVCLLILLVDGKQDVSSLDLKNLTNVISLTTNDIDGKIAKKHHLVLFYAAG